MLLEIIRHLVPDADCAIHGNPTDEPSYDTDVLWFDNRTKPSWSEIEQARSIVEKEIANEAAKSARAVAYRNEADPLYFGWQRGENTEQAWLDKVAEIRARYPYQT
jgi:hypothetical protein